jgi:colicin import membrane protein
MFHLIPMAVYFRFHKWILATVAVSSLLTAGGAVAQMRAMPRQMPRPLPSVEVHLEVLQSLRNGAPAPTPRQPAYVPPPSPRVIEEPYYGGGYAGGYAPPQGQQGRGVPLPPPMPQQPSPPIPQAHSYDNAEQEGSAIYQPEPHQQQQAAPAPQPAQEYVPPPPPIIRDTPIRKEVIRQKTADDLARDRAAMDKQLEKQLQKERQPVTPPQSEPIQTEPAAPAAPPTIPAPIVKSDPVVVPPLVPVPTPTPEPVPSIPLEKTPLTPPPVAPPAMDDAPPPPPPIQLDKDGNVKLPDLPASSQEWLQKEGADATAIPTPKTDDEKKALSFPSLHGTVPPVPTGKGAALPDLPRLESLPPVIPPAPVEEAMPPSSLPEIKPEIEKDDEGHLFPGLTSTFRKLLTNKQEAPKKIENVAPILPKAVEPEGPKPSVPLIRAAKPLPEDKQPELPKLPPEILGGKVENQLEKALKKGELPPIQPPSLDAPIQPKLSAKEAKRAKQQAEKEAAKKRDAEKREKQKQEAAAKTERNKQEKLAKEAAKTAAEAKKKAEADAKALAAKREQEEKIAAKKAEKAEAEQKAQEKEQAKQAALNAAKEKEKAQKQKAEEEKAAKAKAKAATSAKPKEVVKPLPELPIPQLPVLSNVLPNPPLPASDLPVPALPKLESKPKPNLSEKLPPFMSHLDDTATAVASPLKEEVKPQPAPMPPAPKKESKKEEAKKAIPKKTEAMIREEKEAKKAEESKLKFKLESPLLGMPEPLPPKTAPEQPKAKPFKEEAKVLSAPKPVEKPVVKPAEKPVAPMPPVVQPPAAPLDLPNNELQLPELPADLAEFSKNLPPAPSGKIDVIEKDNKPVVAAKPEAKEMVLLTEPPKETKPVKTKAQEKTTPPATKQSVRVVYGRDETSVPSAMKAQLETLAKQAKQSNKRLVINAFASGNPDEAKAANMISLSRALSVRAYLIESGIPQSKIIVKAKGLDNTAGGEADRADVELD